MLVARLQALNTENSAAEADRIAKEAVYREAKEGSLPEVEVSGQSTDLTKDVEKLQVAKANLALVGATYGDQHPEYQKAAAQVDGSPRGARREPRECRHPHRRGLSPNSDSRTHAVAAAVAETKQEVDDLTSQSFNYLQLKHEADTAEQVYEDLFAKIKQSGINSELQNNIVRLADSARPPPSRSFPIGRLLLGSPWPFLLLPVRICDLGGTGGRDRKRGRGGGRSAGRARGLRLAPSLPDMRFASLLVLERCACRRSWRGLQDGFFDEGVRHLRGYLMLSVQTSVPRSVLFTSALPGEGKSTLALSLAMVNAEQGKRTLLIDADLRQPAIERLVRLDPDAGLAEVLAHRTIGVERHVRSPPSRTCSFWLRDALAPGLAQIGPQMREILNQATKEFDLVILDSPPLLGCAETLELAAAAEVAVLAVRSGQTPMKVLAATVETLRRVNVPIAGIVLNESAIAADPTHKAYARYYTSIEQRRQKFTALRTQSQHHGEQNDTASYDCIARVVESGDGPLRALRPVSSGNLGNRLDPHALAVWLCGDIYFPLTTTADAIVLAGVLAFSVGGITAVATPCAGANTRGGYATRRIQVDRWLTGAVIVLPAEYSRSLTSISSNSPKPLPPAKACGDRFASPPARQTYPATVIFPSSHSSCPS